MRRLLFSVLAVSGFGLMFAMAQSARADTISFNLTTQEGSKTLLSPANAVDVTVDLTSSTTATVTFTGAAGGTIDTPVELNVNGAFQAAATDGLAPTSPCGYGTTPCASGSGGGFGTMDLETSAVKGDTITITLTAEDGNTWADAANVLTPTTKGFEAVDEGSSPQTAGSYTPTTVTPEPSSMLLLGTGLLVLVGFNLRRLLHQRRLLHVA